MKRILLLIFFSLFGLISCNKFNSPNYTQEEIEYAKQFQFIEDSLIDFDNPYNLNVKVMQSLTNYEGLCIELNDYERYHGKIVYFISDEPLYDEKIIKDTTYFIGTYHYQSRDSIYRTVPIYTTLKTYENLYIRGYIDIINDMHNY